MEKLLEEFGELVKSKKPELHAALQPGVADIYLQAEFGPVYENLPNDLKAIWLRYNGQSESCSADFDLKSSGMLMSAEDSSEVIDTLSDCTETGLVSNLNWQQDWIPFLQSGDGNHLCVSSETGAVYYFDRNEIYTGFRHASIENWLLNIIDDYKN